MQKGLGWLLVCAASAGAVMTGDAAGIEYYVATNGNDANDGSLGAPFATISTAINAAMPGDTIFVRGGTYPSSSALTIAPSKSGTAESPFRLFAYPGETPILDFRTQPYSNNNSGLKGLDLQANYWHIKGLTVEYAADNGVFVSGSNNTLEQMVARQNQDSGFQIAAAGSGVNRRRPANNLLLNCDSYGNFDYGARGENADGFAIKFRELGPGNVIDGARAWNNGDDGMDFWEAENGVIIRNSWVFNNGISSMFQNLSGSYQGDGNGMKLGQDSSTHLLHNLLVFGHPANGVDVNGNATQGSASPAITHGVEVYNVTAAFNGSRNFRFDENPTTATPPTNHFVKNSVSYGGQVLIHAGNTLQTNTFPGFNNSPLGLGVSESDFISVALPVMSNGVYFPAGTGGDRDGTTMPTHATGPAVAPRLADGSLPPLDFLRLAEGSHLIDAGTDVGLPFSGLAPDLGWFESVPPAPDLPGDFNGDGVVDAGDYVRWRNHLGEANELNINQSGDGCGAGLGDYLPWKEYYGEPSEMGGGGIGSAAIPEPATSLLLLLAGLRLVARNSRPRRPD